MALDIVGPALDFIAAYGLIAIFVLLVMDGALMLPVFPGELVLVMAVAAYADGPGSLVFLILFTTAAGLVGSLILYGVTRGGGRRLVERFPGFFMMPRRRRERLERAFQRPAGQSLVLVLRLLPLTRVLVNIPAGLARMPIVRFVLLSSVGLLMYHTAFLWFAYEARRPGSAISTQKDQLQEAYASPAMDLVQQNAILSGAVLVVLGIVFSVRASVSMWRDPEESAGSVLGWLATVVLFWGGLALAVFTYMQRDTVVLLIDRGGLDIEAIAARIGYSAIQVLMTVALAAMLLGLVLRRLHRTAKVRQKVHVAQAKARSEMLGRAGARSTVPEHPAAAGPVDGGGAPPARRPVQFTSVPRRTFAIVDRGPGHARRPDDPPPPSGVDREQEGPEASGEADRGRGSEDGAPSPKASRRGTQD